MYEKLKLSTSKESAKYIEVLCAHDYSISSYKLKKFLLWFESVKVSNKENDIFDSLKFNKIVNIVLKRFVISYFMERKLKNKLFPFFLLNLKYKLILINYYVNK